MIERRSAIAAAALVALLLVPVALAKGKPPEAGKPPATGPGCRPNVTVVLKGTLTSDPGLGATSFTMNVTGANRHGQSLEGAPATIMVDASTKVRRQGAKTIDALALNDRVLVQVRTCKGSLPLSAATLATLPAARVVAQAAKADNPDRSDDD